MKKKLTKNSADEIIVNAGWFVSLKNYAKRYEKKPTKENLILLLGFIDSAEFIIKNLTSKAK